MYFHTFFYPHVFSKNTNNVTRTTLSNISILKTCFYKCVLQLQLKGCNTKMRKITMLRLLSAILKTYQPPKYAFIECKRVF